MDNLKDLFDRALDDEPAPPPGDLFEAARTQGRRIRRRRGLLVGGSTAAVVIATLVTLNVAFAPSDPEPPVVLAGAALMAPRGSACVAPAHEQGLEISIFLTEDVTDVQRDRLRARLEADPTVRDVGYESRAQAYEKFKDLWRDSPDFVASVGPAQLPESFRMTLADPAGLPAFTTKFLRSDGVQDVVDQRCPLVKK